jgi:hypothetical protein
MKPIGVLGDPFFQCRPEGTHLHPPNIRSMLQAAHDRFQRVVKLYFQSQLRQVSLHPSGKSIVANRSHEVA